MVHYHYHVDRLTDEDSESAYPDIFSALDAVADELSDLTDSEYQGIAAEGNAGDYEAAYRCFQRYERLSGVLSNCQHIVRQNSLPMSERAPLYAPLYQPSGYWSPRQTETRDRAQARLEAAATDHVMPMVNAETPLAMWRCSRRRSCWGLPDGVPL
jgi:hypothetical protein